ncbi:hypothetical protein IFM89_013309, partial [Coptis chinensis]
MTDLGLRQVLAPNGELLQKGDTCYNIELAHTLEAIAEYRPQALYNGTVGESFVKDVREASGILTMEDLRSYKVKVMDAMVVDVMGYTILGMPPPSSGTVGLSLMEPTKRSWDEPFLHRRCREKCSINDNYNKLSFWSRGALTMYCLVTTPLFPSVHRKPHFDQLFKRTGIEVWTKVLKVCGAPGAVKVDKSVDEGHANSKVSNMFGGTQDKCVAWKKTVYPIEKNEMVDYADSESSPEREVEVGGASKMGVMDSWLWNCHMVAGAGCSKPNG